MSVITTIASGDVISTSRSTINTNFANLNSDKIETSYLDTDTTLAANSDTKIPSQKAVKAYIDAGGNPNASETQAGIVEEATDAEVTAGTATGATGAKLFVTPAKLDTILDTRFSTVSKFGGTGADGALSSSSGATNIDCANAAVVVKNYTSISLTGTASLTFTNPHTSGTIVILKSQGNVTITSSTNPAITLTSMGAAAGTAANNNLPIGKPTAGTAGSASATTGGSAVANLSTIEGKVLYLYTGAGGGAGWNGPAGGAGAGCLYIECGGALNISSTILASGTAGANGAGGGSAGYGGAGGGSFAAGSAGSSSTSTTGGGGGGGGVIVIIYGTLTSNTGTYTVAGGAGGSFGGGAGGAGYSLVAANTIFA